VAGLTIAKRRSGMSATYADRQTVDLYWQGIKDTQPLSRDGEVELFRRVRAGDESARHELMMANLRFVVRVAHKYKEHGLSLIELISEGNIGLVEAIRRFDETRGFKFITYAVWWIRQAILRALAENGKAARPPMSQINDLMKVEKEAGALTQLLGRPPTQEEIAVRAEISTSRVQTAMEVGQHALSLDAPVYDDETGSLGSVLPSDEAGADEQLELSEMQRALRTSLDTLDRRELQILRLYFGLEDNEPQTMESIGETMGITRERVRQLRNRALRKVRTHGGDVLADFCTN
jgi:RNA polymerase primary sigma factor